MRKIFNFNKIIKLIQGVVLTNTYANKMKYAENSIQKKLLRLEFSEVMFSELNILIKIVNYDKLPKNGKYLLLSNHRSILDPFIIESALKNTSIFGLWIVKKELYKSFFFRKAVTYGGCIQLDRENVNKKFFQEIKESLKDVNSIFMFPEGTRNKTSQDLLAFKKGVNIIALKNKLPILPIYIKTNAADVLENTLINPQLKKEIILVVGETIDYRERDIEQVYRAMFKLSHNS